MNLKDYLKTKNITPTMLSRMLCISRSTIYNWINGMRPHKRIARIVEKSTKGEVKLKDMGHDNN